MNSPSSQPGDTTTGAVAVRPTLTALVLLALTVAVAVLLPSERGLEALAVLLGAVAAVYVGTAIAREAQIILQSAVAIGFGAVALLGLWVSPWWLVGGWLAHAAWDALQHRGGSPAVPAPWYPTLCLVYDVGIAAVIVIGWT